MGTRRVMALIVNSRIAYSFKMEPSTRVSGMCTLGNETVEEYRFGQMGVDMKVTGRMIRLMAEADSFMLMATCMKVNGKMIRVKDMECIYTLMELSTKESGSKINKKDMALRLGLMEQNMKEDTRTA